MAHEDKGKYFKKHPEGTKVSESLKREILQTSRNNDITCEAAEKISRDVNTPMNEIGVAIDMLNVRMTQCQIGLFGFDDPKKRVPAAETVASNLEAAIRKALNNNQLSCEAAWAIAGQLQLKRLDVSAACEHLKIKIKPCQLGAF